MCSIYSAIFEEQNNFRNLARNFLLEKHLTLQQTNWADDKQSKARNSDGKYRQMALVGFDT